MSERLPLIPGKRDQLCSDVQPIFQEVFRELESFPPIVDPCMIKNLVKGDDDVKLENDWVNEYDKEYKELCDRENYLKLEYAKKISRQPLCNIYKLRSRENTKAIEQQWKGNNLLERKYLLPNIEENPTRETSLWVKNVFNVSSDCGSRIQVQGLGIPPLYELGIPAEASVQQYSLGAARHLAPPPSNIVLQPSIPPKVICCVPSRLYFINFVVGEVHTQMVRLVNTSANEIRLSLLPPARQELDVEIASARGLTVTSGSECGLKIHFRPLDVRQFSDSLLVRVNNGSSVMVPIFCFMQPPILNVVALPVVGAYSSPSEPYSTEGGDTLDLGARLLGDTHLVQLRLDCDVEHAAFFVLTEENWLEFSLSEVDSCGNVLATPFAWWPASWRGRHVHGAVWCRACSAGLHVRALRVLATTAVTRTLHVIADALLYSENHVTIQAHEKDYDICSDDDPSCQYYLNLGVTHPHRSVVGTLSLVNNSPISYLYYWTVRPWGQPSSPESTSTSTEYDVILDPASGVLLPRTTNTVHVSVTNVGATCAVHKAAIVLVLQNIPKESIPQMLYPNIISSQAISTDAMPGSEPQSREVCSVRCATTEVWWEVTPVRFVLQPGLVLMPYSARVSHVDMRLCATQLCGSQDLPTQWWQFPLAELPLAPILTPAHSKPVTLRVPLPPMPDGQPHMDVFTLSAANNQWLSSCRLVRFCSPRSISLSPPQLCAGAVRPGTSLQAMLTLENNTYQQVCWNVKAWSWPPQFPKTDKRRQVLHGDDDEEHNCDCKVLEHGQKDFISYETITPEEDGPVLTLVQVKTCGARAAWGPISGRAALLRCWVLAPQLVLRLRVCAGGAAGDPACVGCGLDYEKDDEERHVHGGRILRPAHALIVGHRMCYRAVFINITPVRTSVLCKPPLDTDEVLDVKFTPNEFNIGPYETVEVQVVVSGQRVSGRRVWVCCCEVMYARKPIYLLIDTAVTGVEVTFEVPLGARYPNTDSVLNIRRTQKEDFSRLAVSSSRSGETTISSNSAMWKTSDEICKCPVEFVYIAPNKQEHYSEINKSTTDNLLGPEIVSTPPSLTTVCKCATATVPVIPDHEYPLCLQFKDVPLRTVMERVVTVRNSSTVSARWCATIHRFHRIHRRTIDTDKWASGVGASGMALQCVPAQGVLSAAGVAEVKLLLYADCWGLYHDQLLIHVAGLVPFMMDVWAEVIGPPLRLLSCDVAKGPSTLWLTVSDPRRVVRLKNISRCPLILHNFIVREHENVHDSYPFRLLLRFTEEPCASEECVCMKTNDGEDAMTENSVSEEEECTGIELYLGRDYGMEDSKYFKVEHKSLLVNPGETVETYVTMLQKHNDDMEITPTAGLVVAITPQNNFGSGWYRPVPEPLYIKLCQAPRVSTLCCYPSTMRVWLCALDLPPNDELRVRKSLLIKNLGNSVMKMRAVCRAGWSLVRCRGREIERNDEMSVSLPARSSLEIYAEVNVVTSQVWPKITNSVNENPIYDEKQIFESSLDFYDDIELVYTIPFILELEYPHLIAEPSVIDIGCVTDGEQRKTYFTIRHTSRTAFIKLELECTGNPQYRIWPKQCQLAPRQCERIYMQYSARWSCTMSCEECLVRVRSISADSWCNCVVIARASPARDHRFHKPPHDHTDDTRLLPSSDSTHD